MPNLYPKIFLSLLIVVAVLMVGMPLTAQISDILKLLKKQEAQSGGQGLQFAVSPPMLTLKAPVGGIAEGEIVVYNGASFDGSVSIGAMEQKETSPGRFEDVSDPAFLPSTSLINNLEFLPKTVLLPSRSSKKVKVRVKIVSGMKGTLYARLILSLSIYQESPLKGKKEEASKYTRTTALGIGVGQGVQLVVNVAGSGSYDYALEKAEVVLPTATELLSGRLTVRSTSPFEMTAMVGAVVLDEKNTSVARLKPDFPRRMRPGEVRTYQTLPSAVSLSPGSYKMIFTVSGQDMPSKTVEEPFVVK